MDNAPDIVLEDITSPGFLSKLQLLDHLTRRLLRYRPTNIKQGQKGFEFLEHRPYLPGDDLGQVDWNVYQRLQEVVVKEYATETFRNWTILVDVSRSMFLYDKFSCVRQVVASLMFIALSLSDKVNFISFPGESLKIVPYCGKRLTREMLWSLSNLRPVHPIDRFSLRQMIASFQAHSKAIVVSDFYDPSYQDFFHLLSLKKICGVALHVVSKEEIFPSITGEMELQDSESGERKRVSVTPTVLKRYEKKFQLHMAQIKSFCLKHHVAYKQMRTDTPFFKNVLDILRLAGIVR